MAALLRHGAVKRLGRSMIQRAQAAAVEERRRRLMHTDEHVRKQVMLEIQQKKEELYDVISRAKKDFSITNQWNRRLARDLSIQVTPRPYDRNWCRLRIVKNINTILRVAGVLTLPFGIALGEDFIRHPRAEDKAAEPVLASKSSGDNM